MAVGGVDVAAAGPEFGVRAALTGETTLDANHYAFALPAGGHVSDAIVVSNFSDAPLNFAVHGADLMSVAGGGVAPTPEGSAPHQVGRWISVSREQLTVPAHQELNDPFILTIPAGTGPGDYLGAVVVAKQGATAQSVRVLTRAALIVKATVPGQIHLGPSLGPLAGDRHGNDEDFVITVHNSGSVLFTFVGEVTVRDGNRVVSTVALAPQGIYVIPGGSATVHATWRDVPAVGQVVAVATVRVQVSGVPSGSLTSNALRLSFFPWLRLGEAVLVLLAIMIIVISSLILRRRTGVCSHCGTRQRRGLAAVTDPTRVLGCRRCLRRVRNAGSIWLCNNCLKRHLMPAGREASAPAQPT